MLGVDHANRLVLHDDRDGEGSRDHRVVHQSTIVGNLDTR